MNFRPGGLAMITCQISELSNSLGIFTEDCIFPSVVIPNDFIDEFISALQEHMSSEGDGETFTIDFTAK